LNDAEVRRFNHQLYLVRQTKDLSDWQSGLSIGDNLELPDGLGIIHLKSVTSDAVTNSRDAQSFSLTGVQGALRVIFNPEGLSAHPVGRGHSRKLKK
ncbi:tRNA(Ile)-lysidine synthetase, partial [Vibrio sp. 10N.261.48.A2]